MSPIAVSKKMGLKLVRLEAQGKDSGQRLKKCAHGSLQSTLCWLLRGCDKPGKKHHSTA